MSCQCYRDTGTEPGMEWKPVVNRPSHVLSMLQGYRYWAGNGVEASCESALTCLVNVTGIQVLGHGVEASCESALTCLVNVTGIQVLGREWSGSQL